MEPLHLPIGTPHSAHLEIEAAISAQLEARAQPDSSVWGDDPTKRMIAARLCQLTQEEYEWPNDYFLPADPCGLVFFHPWDYLIAIEVILRLREDFAVKFDCDEDAFSAISTLGEVVDWLTEQYKVAKTKRWRLDFSEP
jgi:hypothetical protein